MMVDRLLNYTSDGK